jgi:hypothetical protein
LALPDPTAKKRCGSSEGLGCIGCAQDTDRLDDVESVWAVGIDRF